MCGIVGWVDWEREPYQYFDVLKQMNDSLSHRGPDDGNVYFHKHAGLGHRRLIVVDPDGGAQPMTRKWKERTCTITYNGELYNTMELRRALKALGHTFLTQNSDTEVLLLAYLEWGADCLKRLNGIFAFGIWDHERELLFLARDRLGVKPLFYYQLPHGLLFASEPKALLSHPDVPAQVNAEGLAEIFVMGPSRTPGHAVFSNMKEIRPGHCLTYTREGLREDVYWSLTSRPHEDDLETTACHLREILGDAVSRQLVADVPVCTLLSGGLDSSTITALVQADWERKGLGPITTLSVDYIGQQHCFKPNDFEKDNDQYWALHVAEILGTQHSTIQLDNDELADTLFHAMRANDLPGMTDIDSSLYLFCREIKKKATVALSGECADEIFGGYPWFNERGSIFPWIRMLKEREQLLSPELVTAIRPEEYLLYRYEEAQAEVPYFPDESDQDRLVREMFYLNITRFMPTLLNRKDRMSMAWGLEIRVPFSDHRLVEYVWNIPWKLKRYGNMPKGILRLAMQRALPEEVLYRAKSPYPRTHHQRYSRLIREKTLEMLSDNSSPITGLVNGEKLKELILTGRRCFFKPWFGQLMGDDQYLAYLLQVNWWLQHYRMRIL